MYTGITQGLFVVTYVKKDPHLFTYTVKFSDKLLNGLTIGASVSVDGTCQTVVKIHNHNVTFNAIEETCRKTTLSNLIVGQKVSIERSISHNAEIGGHQMYGHIYGTADILKIEKWENNLKFTFKCQPKMMSYIIEKGFIGVNGSSLTVSDVDLLNNSFSVNLIPHTLQLTDFPNKKMGDKVNIELEANTVTIVDTIKRLKL
ncbi:MAG: riboflavin synthase subunit alpha [Gammaproteobacteria bacterium RIFCSPHIGHO2_12_FULL_41_15]|nr:MAG: riboflavin synthase subunit alpha [Gammaproteobacteria bacterium RIFCSPHIGHO2_12_FULL_41_15]